MSPRILAPGVARRGTPRFARGTLLTLAVLVLVVVFSPACGRKRPARSHAAEETPAALAPTPDNTPIDVLRTPAGLVLKTDEPTPRETTPVPSPGPAPGKNS